MDPVTLFMMTAFFGGLVLALWLSRTKRASHRQPGPVRGEDQVRLDVIDIARIKVAGVGGLGFVVVALAVAASIPSIGVLLAIGCASGAILAIGLIFWRRRVGPMPSSSQRPGANTTLSIETAEQASDLERHDQGPQQHARSAPLLA